MAGKPNARIESAVDRIRDLNDRIVNAAKEGGEESVKTYERMLENLAEAQEAAGDRGADWIREFSRAQANFTRQLADAFPALLERIGARSRDVGGAATERIRQVPGAKTAEGVVRGVVSREDDLPIADYDELNVAEVTAKLDTLSDVELGRIESYEARTKNRKTIHDKITSLRSS
ncbi:hypothetical protein [Pseudonocardia spinosispora]|uniref:hypothetical protein n=1 Tax=Pseudonocardia spinosispora TaxID=103441 RepID=UPI00040DB45A|nr:hypothetical protein [Pseudonocardia spinosispora]